MKYRVLILCAMLCLGGQAFAQFTEFHPELNWYSIKGKHCVVHFHDNSERTARVVAKIADEVWDPITSLYEYQPETVHFVIKDIDDYSNGATYFFDNKIEIWCSALDFELRGFHNWLRNVISHEFTHMVQIQAAMKTKRTLPAVYVQWLNYEDERRPDILYGYPNVIVSYPVAFLNMPAWFAEGTAQYMRKDFGYDRWDAHRDMILRSYALDGNMLTWEQMGQFDKTSLGNESVYNSGFALTRYISQKYGEQKLRELTKALGKFTNFTFDAACKDILHITGKELYLEWSGYLKKDYAQRMQPVLENTVEGKVIFTEGFGNFFPQLYDSSHVLFISNKENDYLSQTSAYLLDLKTGKDKLVFPAVRSAIRRIPNSNVLIYSKLCEDNPGYANVHDIFTYDIDAEKETRVTYAMRANEPAISPDGQLIAFVFEKDGTANLGIVDRNGKNFRQLTVWGNGEQVSNPKFSPDGKSIIFDYALTQGRDIATVNTDGSNLHFLLNSPYDERNAVYVSPDKIIYASDKTGIFNIYSYDLQTKESRQLTNVKGGAFMPAMGPDGTIYYAGYTSAGYKLFAVTKAEQERVNPEKKYVWKDNPPLGEDKPNGDIQKFALERLQNFDDSKLPDYAKEKYSGSYSKLTFFPVLRVDNYNKWNSFTERIKPGLYVSSSDMLNRYSIFGGAMINSQLERDMFFIFDYRNKLPLLFDIGIKPELSLELYSISRKSGSVDVVVEELGQTKTDVTYNLFEVALEARHRFLSRFNFINFRYSFSRYTSEIGAFVIPGSTTLSPDFTDPYLLGSNFEVSYKFDSYKPYLHSEINPVGTEFEVKFNYEVYKFNPSGDYNNNDGVLEPVYKHYDFPRVEVNLLNAFKVFSNSSFTVKARYGAILNTQLPDSTDFFDFYLGGLAGMKEYPFYAIGGKHVAWLNLTYRFPLWQNIDAQIGHLYVDKIFMSVFADMGNAWNGAMPSMSDFKKGVGAELRFALNSFYMFPTSVFFDACYGLDSFTRTVRGETLTYGKEIRLYAGILFDFNL